MSAKTKRMAWTVGIALVVVGYGLLLWRGPWWFDGAHLRSRDLQPADGVVITGFRTALVALGAGAVAGIGLYYTHHSHRHTEKLFEHTREKDREQVELAREGQVTDRYVEAIKLLSSGNLTQRLGGIYSLERIMRDSEKDHDTVVEVLAAFVREHADEREAAPDQSGDRHPTDDVQAALTVLGRRPHRGEPFTIDLSHTNLQGARLSGARLDSADLTGAILKDAMLNAAFLSGTQLWQADLRGANLCDAQMQGANLGGAHLGQANFSNANLRGAELGVAKLDDAFLQGTDLVGALGLFTGKLVTARLFSTTRLPSRFAGDPRIQARRAECDASPTMRRPD
ncbi:pentapeptide repeat-containing protein [Streptomyces sp. NPDC060065]|uniref:pentapeptide repeat-containing protein n=1 Tax=Streptomyces sp. NPDC060065 TaxID=3347050 RepID=UPI003675B14E